MNAQFLNAFKGRMFPNVFSSYLLSLCSDSQFLVQFVTPAQNRGRWLDRICLNIPFREGSFGDPFKILWAIVALSYAFEQMLQFWNGTKILSAWMSSMFSYSFWNSVWHFLNRILCLPTIGPRGYVTVAKLKSHSIFHLFWGPLNLCEKRHSSLNRDCGAERLNRCGCQWRNHPMLQRIEECQASSGHLANDRPKIVTICHSQIHSPGNEFRDSPESLSHFSRIL
jgi:hypothetical protein